jgi:predicted TPR repeat methyltransferase
MQMDTGSLTAPGSLAPAAPADARLAERLLDRARLLLQERRPLEALPMLDRLDRLPGLEGAAATLRAEALFGLARLEEAAAAADVAIAEGPGDPHRLRLRARIRLARGERPGAIDDAAAAVMAVPSDPGAKALLGTALLEDRRFDEAVYFLGEAFRADPGNPLSQARLGQAFMLAGRHEAAAEIMAHCELHAPAMPGIAALRAQNALLAGDAALAATLARAALARGVVEASVHSTLAHALVAAGCLMDAAPHFTAAARLAPQDHYLAHLAAAASGIASDRATDGYVTALFDGYAPRFEDALLSLGYRVPGLFRRAVERLLPAVAVGEARLGPVLDLGCGTGLVGVALADLLGGPLVGVDLSRGMLEQAAAKGIYAELRLMEIAAALRQDAGAHALISAGDVFCYLGRLEEVLDLCRQRLAPGGLLLFSVERGAQGSAWQLGQSGRYAHAPDYLETCLATAGLAALEWREEDIRLDAGGPVPGLVVAARAAGH